MLGARTNCKLIALVEELRQDIPNVKNCSDPKAEMMKSPTDPHVIIDVLEETLASELASFSQQKTSIEE
ncbi:hypothetical protein [Nostoc edaphicum]|uniref:hypothetical protein n=1 Tax=Nostoc edaphicum TaxID=264686 RepID=UPI001D148B95|nr:hypothetical protein [Nostoc edaphicum]